MPPERSQIILPNATTFINKKGKTILQSRTEEVFRREKGGGGGEAGTRREVEDYNNGRGLHDSPNLRVLSRKVNRSQ